MSNCINKHKIQYHKDCVSSDIAKKTGCVSRFKMNDKRRIWVLLKILDKIQQ